MGKKTAKQRPNDLERALRQAILDSGRSYNDLARSSGVPVPTISRFVRGERSMGIESAGKLASALGLALGYLAD